MEHYCEYMPGQAVVRGLEVDPEDFEFEPVEIADLFLGGEAGDEGAQAEQTLAFLEEPGNDVRIYKLKNPADDLFQRIDEFEGAGGTASPHYLLRPAGYWGWGPYNEVMTLPQGQWDDLEVTGPANAPEGSRLVVIDTGASGDLASIGVNGVDQEAVMDPRAIGHGTFAAAVAKNYNPGLNVELYRASFADGTLNEFSLTVAFQRAQPGDDVVSLSLGTYPCHAEEHPPLVLEIGLAGQVVAASGNDGRDHMPEMLYPASRDDVIGVSAYDTSWDMASWANPGEVYAPGEDVVSYYDDGTSASLAIWSGTSFATPHYAACVASGICP
jgi:hypothetical protein